MEEAILSACLGRCDAPLVEDRTAKGYILKAKILIAKLISQDIDNEFPEK